MSNNPKIAMRRHKQIQRLVQAKKRQERYFAICQLGDKVTINNETYAILNKYELPFEAYYFVVQDKNYKVYLVRIAAKNKDVILIKIPRTSAEYEKNSEVFEGIVKGAKEYRKCKLEEFFNTEYKKHEVIAIRHFSHNEDGVEFGKFVSKCKYKGDYYFVMKNNVGEFVITKVIWFRFPKLIFVTEKEYAKETEMFEKWIVEAKKKPRKKKETI